MKRWIPTLLLSLFCLMSLPFSSHAAQLTLDGRRLDVGEIPIYNDTTYAPFRGVVQALCPQAEVSWEDNQAVARWNGHILTARPGESAFFFDGESVSTVLPIRLEDGRTLVPVRPLCNIFGVLVEWYADAKVAALHTDAGRPYSEDDLYWLSRIISAESQGEPWEGKLAVGHVVLNRVAHPEFPDSIYGVIFDDRWGGQFEPVRNGTIYLSPTEESVQAAITCLSGGDNPVGSSLYFLAPALTSNHWTMENRDYVTTIGAHWFYR